MLKSQIWLKYMDCTACVIYTAVVLHAIFEISVQNLHDCCYEPWLSDLSAKHRRGEYEFIGAMNKL